MPSAKNLSYMEKATGPWDDLMEVSRLVAKDYTNTEHIPYFSS